MVFYESLVSLEDRDGRTYTCTDGEPNADKLFVFHREVQKVRERLAASGH